MKCLAWCAPALWWAASGAAQAATVPSPQLPPLAQLEIPELSRGLDWSAGWSFDLPPAGLQLPLDEVLAIQSLLAPGAEFRQAPAAPVVFACVIGALLVLLSSLALLPRWHHMRLRLKSLHW